MDVLLIAGVSKSHGSQFSLKKGIHLSRNGEVMSYGNLERLFGVSSTGGPVPDSAPYLAGIYLYHFLTRRGITCGLIQFLDLELERFQQLLRSAPKVIAVSTTFLTDIGSVRNVTQTIRRYAPGIPIVLGGPLVYNSYMLYRMRHGDYDTDSCRRDYFFLQEGRELHEDVDLFVVEEQGEETLYRVIRALKDRGDVSEIPNLAYYDRNGRLVFTPRSPEDNSFEEDLVDWSAFPEQYLSSIFPLRGSRGCPYRCAYCNFSVTRKFRLKDTDTFAREISALADTGKVKLIRFTDDNLFLTRRHVEDYAGAMVRAGQGMRWSSFIRASSITRENVGLIRDSGCVLAQIGMESGHRNILRAMNKKDDPEHYLEVVALLNAHGISTQLYFIVGFPGETEETVQETIDLINRFPHEGAGINHIMVFPFVLAPLSPVYLPQHREKYRLSGYMTEWKHDTMDSGQAYAHAKRFFAECRHVYPFYGIDEFCGVDLSRLKQVARLRMRIREAEIRHAAETAERGWEQLRAVITAK